MSVSVGWPASIRITRISLDSPLKIGLETVSSRCRPLTRSCSSWWAPGPLFADKVVHHRHVDRVAGRAEAAELPAVLDRPQQGVVVVGDGRAACRVAGAGDHDREYVSAARAGAAASACVRKPTRARRAHVALVPRDEDHRVPLPGARGHDLADPAAEERVASGDQLRRMRGAAGIARRAATVHVMTLIGTDPVV